MSPRQESSLLLLFLLLTVSALFLVKFIPKWHLQFAAHFLPAQQTLVKHCSTNYPSKHPEEVSHWLSTHPGTDHVVGRCQSDTCYIIPWFHAQFSLSKLKKLEGAV